jgi:hypothetical protein
MLYLIVGLIVLAVAANACFLIYQRCTDDRKHLEPLLAQHGLQFVSAESPGFPKTGPFPAVEFRKGAVLSKGPIQAEFSKYRIVTVRDEQGTEHQIWAQLEFVLYRLRRVRWRAEQPEELPDSIRGILEQ